VLKASLWQAGVTYFVGSVVADSVGTLWKSNQRNNLGNQPGMNASGFIGPGWEPYFGPLTAEPFDSSQGYLASEIAYTLSGAGTYNVWASLVSGNVVHPALPSQWSGTTIYNTNAVVNLYPAWAIGTTYAAGATVTYTDGNTYSSLAAGNVGHAPSSSPTQWALMPTLTLQSQLVPESTFSSPAGVTSTPIDEWQIETAYSAGAFAIFNGSIYLSIANSNTGNYPNAAASAFWALTTGGTLYQSLIDLNQGNSPANAPALWASGTTYAAGNKVGGSDGFIYSSVGSGNVGNNPVTDGGVHWTNTGVYNPWTTVFTLGGGNSQWIQVGGGSFPNGVGLAPLMVTWPANCGPASDSFTRDIYRLPAGYLRRAPQDASAGRSSWLGAPSNLPMNDWEFDDDFLISSETDVIVLRFVADVQDVTKFPDMLCEALACDIALEVCEPLTQSTAKLTAIAAERKGQLERAKTANAIDMEADEPPLDDWIACRA
jgi:hypothetical protein